jgi:isopenicillin N synthase-like dioxygenase
MSHATAKLRRHDDAEIPIMDLAPYLAGGAPAVEELAAQLRYALERVGFYFIKGHGVAQSLCDEVFKQAERLCPPFRDVTDRAI